MTVAMEKILAWNYDYNVCPCNRVVYDFTARRCKHASNGSHCNRNGSDDRSLRRVVGE